VPHADAGRLDNLLRDWTSRHGSLLGGARYDIEAHFEVWCPAGQLPALQAEVAAMSSGAVTAAVTGAERVIDVPR